MVNLAFYFQNKNQKHQGAPLPRDDYQNARRNVIYQECFKKNTSYFVYTKI